MTPPLSSSRGDYSTGVFHRAPIVDRRTQFEDVQVRIASPKERAKAVSLPKRRIGALFFVFVLVGSLTAVLLSYAEPASSYETGPPIVIDDDSDFVEGQNGVRSGSGVPGDPYIISDWEIVGSGGTGIWVLGTTKHFVISNVHVNSTHDSGWFDVGILFEGVANGSVEGSVVNQTWSGIIVTDSENVTLEGNSITDCYYAVSLGGTNGVHDSMVASNTMSDGVEGLSLNLATRCQIEGNEVSSFSSYGVYTYWSDNVNYSSNNVSSCQGLGGMYLESTQDCVVFNNTFVGNTGTTYAGGVSLYSCSGTLLYHNCFYDNSDYQAYDCSGTGNSWNSIDRGNYWNDWTTPDVDSNGIVDDPYSILDSSQDNYPLTQPPGSGSGVPIPEFGTVAIPVITIVAVFLLVRRRK